MKKDNVARSRSGKLIAAVSLVNLVAASSALATDLYWDSNGTAAGAGTPPTGNWATSTFWNSDSTGGAGGSFVGSTTAADNAFFSAGNDATGAYTVTLSTPQNVQNISLQEGAPTITGSSLTLNGTALISTAAGTNLVITSTLAGVTGTTLVVKDGAGTLTLGGSATNPIGTSAGGGLLINDGVVVNNKSGSALGIQGTSGSTTTAITIGDGIGAADSAVYRFLGTSSNALGRGRIEFKRDGLLELNNGVPAIDSGRPIFTGGGRVTTGATGEFRPVTDFDYISIASGGRKGEVAGNMRLTNTIEIHVADDTVLSTEFAISAKMLGAGGTSLNFDNATNAGVLEISGDNSGYAGNALFAVGLTRIGSGGLGTGSLTFNGTGTNGFFQSTDATSRTFSNAITAILRSPTFSAADGGTGGLYFTNTGNVTLSVSSINFVVNNSVVSLSQSLTRTGSAFFQKNGPGELELRGNNSAYTNTGTFSVINGGLGLNYALGDTTKLPDGGQLILNGGRVWLRGGAHTEVVASTALQTGTASVYRDGAGSGILQLGAITRTVGGTIDFGGAGEATVSLATSGLIGGWATVNKSGWASNAASGTNSTVSALGAGSYTTQNNAASWTSSQNITNDGAYTGTVGTLTISTLRFNNASAGTVTVGAANTLTISTGGILVTPDVGADTQTITGGIVRGSLTSSQDLVVHQHNTAAALVIASQITTSAGNTGLTKTGDGTLILAPTTANTYSGATRVNGGVLRLGGTANAIPGGIGATGGTSNIELRGGVLGLENGDFSRGLGTGATQIQFTSHGGFAAYGGDRTVNLGGANALIYWNDGVASTPGAMIRTGYSFILSAADADAKITFSNPLELRGNIAETNFYTPSPLADRVFDVRNGSAAIDGELSGVVSGLSARLSKMGTGTLLLSGANTYTSDTRVGEGTLLISNSNDSGRARVQSGATFGGTGSLKGYIDAEAGSSVAPGTNGIGVLTAGGLTLGGNAKLKFDINTTTDTADQLIITSTTLGNGGMVNLGSAVLELSFNTPVAGPYTESFTLIRNDTGTYVTGLLNGIAQNGTFNNGALVYSINYAFDADNSDGLANDVRITFTAVPEPSTVALLAIGAAGLLRRRRRC